MKRILYGNEAKEMLEFLLQDNGKLMNYQTKKDEQYRCKGIFRNSDMYTAFDNTTGQCVEESYPEFEVTLFWLEGGSIDDIIHICRCNNCMLIMEDNNSQIGAKNYIRTGREVNMEKFEENGELFWGCPNCKTDAYLTDL